jgi:hypothetical protein
MLVVGCWLLVVGCSLVDEQRTINKEPSTKNNQQRTIDKEQSTKNNQHR